MKSVKHLLATKQGIIFSVKKGTSVLDGLQLMMEENISALLIVEDDIMLGIFTERDYARKIILQGRSSKDTPISEVMTTDVITLKLSDGIDHCMQVMTKQHIRHLPVLEDNKVIGMISIGDLVKFVIEEQKKTIEHLESYINS